MHSPCMHTCAARITRGLHRCLTGAGFLFLGLGVLNAIASTRLFAQQQVLASARFAGAVLEPSPLDEPLPFSTLQSHFNDKVANVDAMRVTLGVSRAIGFEKVKQELNEDSIRKIEAEDHSVIHDPQRTDLWRVDFEQGGGKIRLREDQAALLEFEEMAVYQTVEAEDVERLRRVHMSLALRNLGPAALTMLAEKHHLELTSGERKNLVKASEEFFAKWARVRATEETIVLLHFLPEEDRARPSIGRLAANVRELAKYAEMGELYDSCTGAPRSVVPMLEQAVWISRNVRTRLGLQPEQVELATQTFGAFGRSHAEKSRAVLERRMNATEFQVFYDQMLVDRQAAFESIFTLKQRSEMEQIVLAERLRVIGPIGLTGKSTMRILGIEPELQGAWKESVEAAVRSLEIWKFQNRQRDIAVAFEQCLDSDSLHRLRYAMDDRVFVLN